MRPWNTWLYGLGLAGALSFGLAGCGGGDEIPSDELAAEEGGEAEAEATMPPPPQAPAPAPAPTPDVAATPDAAAPAAPAPPPGPGAVAPDAPAPPPGPVTGEPATATPDAPPADAQPATKSETAEMLAMATGAAAPALSVADAPAGTAPGAPGAEPDAGQLGFPGAMNGPGGEAEARGAFGSGDREGIAGPGSLGGPPGMGEAAGGASELKPGDTNTANGAVEAFLYALSKKDPDRLQQATALRASTDEGGKYREMFSRILDVSISDSEIDELAVKLEGYRPAGMNQVKSTGRQGVTIRKQLKDGGWIQRTVTVRKEKKGWGVLDISGATEFENMRVRNPRRR